MTTYLQYKSSGSVIRSKYKIGDHVNYTPNKRNPHAGRTKCKITGVHEGPLVTYTLQPDGHERSPIKCSTTYMEPIA